MTNRQLHGSSTIPFNLVGGRLQWLMHIINKLLLQLLLIKIPGFGHQSPRVSG